MRRFNLENYNSSVGRCGGKKEIAKLKAKVEALTKGVSYPRGCGLCVQSDSF
jgi:hypothetical protein